jgi:nitroreductase/NAD-dependent dihydropyrimidine dehydrogenase PreA subunit
VPRIRDIKKRLQGGRIVISIDREKCKACGICGHVCPRHIPETIERGDEKQTVVSSERIDLCMECGHCEAVCPTGAIHVDGLDREGFGPVEDLGMDEDRLLRLMKQRRSVRRYRNKPVPREIIDGIIKGVGQAPTGTGRRSIGVIVMEEPDTLKAFSEMVYGLYEKLDKNLNNPIARFFIKRQVGERMLHTLTDFVMPGMHWYIRWYREGRGNEVLRDCPALMLFHSPVMEPMAPENCLVAAFHAIFMAQVLGIGTCFNDLIPPACNRVSEIKALLGLPEDREVYSSITLGYPKYKFQRTIPRKLAEVRYL